MSIVDEIKQSYKSGSTLTRLIYINIGVFVSIRLIQLFLGMATGSMAGASYPLVHWLSVPSEPMELLIKPWTLFTYMFVHEGFFHILFNILYLYWFGRLFLQYLMPKQMLSVYILGGLSGAVLYLVAYNFIPLFVNNMGSSVLLGASASVMAILFAISRYAPNQQIHLMFFGPVQLKYIALIAFVIDLISIPSLENAGGHLAHIGGAGFGYFYGASIANGKDLAKGFGRFMDSLSSVFSRKPKMRVKFKRPVSDLEYNTRKHNQQREVDRILEKIKASGYDSLSKNEKKTLFDASKK